MQIERQLQGTLNTIFTEIIKERGLEKRIQPYTVIEENRADITLKTAKGKTLFFIELKDPTANDGQVVFNPKVILRELARAQKNDINYFGICNFVSCAFFNTKDIDERVSINDEFLKYQDITRLSENYAPSNEVLKKLSFIAEFYLNRAIEILDKKPVTYTPLDKIFIFKIRTLIEAYALPISKKVWECYHSDKNFEKEINKYCQNQLWNKPQTFEEIENLTHISLLMLISKLIFYKSYIDNRILPELEPLRIPERITEAETLQDFIWNVFEKFKEATGNFELLIGEKSNIIFKIPFVSDEIIELVKDIFEPKNRYSFSNIPYDIVGRIFEELIRADERHKLGQYFTPPEVIDFINTCTIHKGKDTVFDPSCGSGTFLVRAYEHKRVLCEKEGKKARHSNLLTEIYGNDLSDYPAYLSMLNLAIRDTFSPSYPRITNKDFFSIAEFSKFDFHTFDIRAKEIFEKKKQSLPKFDVIVGNPPYTRQEDIGTMFGTVGKDTINELIRRECGFTPSQRTSIYAYFFYHANVFLREGGYLGYICQNSWLDADYGADLQRFMLNNFEIVAIIDSEVERFFPSASVNTTIVILKKQREEEKRNQNIVKFVYLKKTLHELTSQYKGNKNLYETIIETTESTENNFLKINCIEQKTLAEHTKWGQFLKAPKVYYDVLEKGKEKFKPLKEIADDVIRGYMTGCNDFFILEDITYTENADYLKVTLNNFKNKYKDFSDVKVDGLRLVRNGFGELWLIEDDFLFPMLTSPKDVNRYEITPEELPFKMLFVIDKERKEIKKWFPYANDYIKHGEEMKLNKINSLAARKKWWFIKAKKLPDLSFNYIINEAGRTFKVKAYTNNNFHNIFSDKRSKTIFYFMNSTISWLNQQIIMRANLGDGAGKIEKYELADFLVPNIDLENYTFDLGETRNFREELGTLESLATVNPERVKLDDTILEKIGFTDETERQQVLLELYRATYNLIDKRLSKSKSLKTVKSERNRVPFEAYVKQLNELLIDNKTEAKETQTFARELEKTIAEISLEKRLQKRLFDNYWYSKFGKNFNEKEVANASQMKLF
jgi:16S rRNA A1518/A1519 N6-dimethyltransferase RsmA/KsgA/DIM1 with predicted DNA glycosylase/AP lyase activity